VAAETFDGTRRVQNLAHIGLGVITGLEFRHIRQALVDAVRPSLVRRNLCGQSVRLGQRYLQRPAHVTHGGLGAECSECDYLRHVLVAVFIAAVLDYLLAPVVGEVQVDIGRRDALH